jgi:protein arginine N-methyltransferase 3
MTSTLPVRESRPQDDDLSSNSSSDGSDVFNTKAEEGWEDVEPDVEEEQIVSLLDGETFPTVQAMLAYCKDKYNFDFLELRDKFSLDFYGSIKLVNFIRSAVKDNGAPPSNIRLEDFDKDDFLKPVIADDALLFNLDELPPAQSETASQQSGDKALVDRIAQLEEELKRTQSHFEDYRALATKTLDDRWNDSSKTVAGPAENAEEKRDDDSHYFSSYSYNGKFSNWSQSRESKSNTSQISTRPC